MWFLLDNEIKPKKIPSAIKHPIVNIFMDMVSSKLTITSINVNSDLFLIFIN